MKPKKEEKKKPEGSIREMARTIAFLEAKHKAKYGAKIEQMKDKKSK